MSGRPVPMLQFSNHLLAALPDEDRNAVLVEGEVFAFRRAELVADAGGPVECVVFPLSGLMAVEATVGNGRSVVIALIGRAGAAGFETLLGAGASATARVVGVVPGRAVRVPAGAVRRLAAGPGAIGGVLRTAATYQALDVQQTAACNARHGLEARLARWVLAVQEALGTEDLPITHEFLATALGVRRAGVTGTMGAFQTAGLLRQGRAYISLLDHAGLERVACGCHAELRQRSAALRAGSKQAEAADWLNPDRVAARGALRAVLALRAGREPDPEQRLQAVLRACHEVVDRCRVALKAS